MRFLMREKIFSWGDDFTIQDGWGRDAFRVRGRAFSIGDKLSLQDMYGNELAYIEQKLFNWGPTYEVFRAGQLFAVIKKEIFSFFTNRFQIDGPGANDLEAEGDFFEYNYIIKRQGYEIARASREFFSFTDTYGIDIMDNEDPVYILAVAIVIDQAMEGKDKGGFSFSN